jgi:hypothetical protein
LSECVQNIYKEGGCGVKPGKRLKPEKQLKQGKAVKYYVALAGDIGYNNLLRDHGWGRQSLLPMVH